ncbi:hypothetical protein K438DRAFT_1788402 [Mycena galopus ATCC 62051]|nr:hypothetical protein K438DRAFT_1788402 [Mycena galopus ATCC 62051]
MESCGEFSGKHEAPATRTERRQPHYNVPGWGSGLPLWEPGIGTRHPSETRVPRDSRNTTPDAEDAPGYYPTWVSDPTKQPWDDQEEKTPRTGRASRPKKCGEMGTAPSVFSTPPTGRTNLNNFSRPLTANRSGNGMSEDAQPPYNCSRGKGVTSGNAGARTMDLNPRREGDPRATGSTPIRPRNRNLAQEQAEACPQEPWVLRCQDKTNSDLCVQKGAPTVPPWGARVGTGSKLWNNTPKKELTGRDTPIPLSLTILTFHLQHGQGLSF